MLKKQVTFQLEDIVPSWAEDYSEDKFSIYRTTFLSTKKNSHNLNISEEVLRRDAKSILGNFLVAKIEGFDASTHLPSEQIFGYYPKEQEIIFEEYEDDVEGKVVTASAYAVVSKLYGRALTNIFTSVNKRNGSVEMSVDTDNDDENNVTGFNIYGLTCLGMTIKGSCPDANMTVVRFSEDDAESFFKNKTDNFALLKQFAKDRQYNMTESKTYKIDKSKEAMSTDDWSNVDKTAMRNKIMDAANRDALVKSVYLDVRDGWKDAPSSNLKYPVMELKGDTFVYNRNALASAKGYAEKNNETEVLKKLNSIYKKLDLDEGKGDDAKMSEVAFAAVDIGQLWGQLWDALARKYPDNDYGSVYRIDAIYEEDNKKFVIIHYKDEATKYRLDFSLTEEGLTLSDEIVQVTVEIVETDNVKRFAEPENADKYKRFEDCHDDDDDDDNEKEVSMDEMKAKVDELTKEIENRDNIIMEKDKELEELRAFKADIENKEKMSSIDAIMNEVKSCLSEQQFNDLKEEGVNCEMSQIDGWKNKVKAVCFDATKGQTQGKNDVWAFAAPATIKSTPKTAIERLKEQLGE